jgi:hypothetical protein
MILMHDTSSMQTVVTQYPDAALRSLLELRMAQLAPPDGADIGEAVQFLVFEPGDQLCQLEANIGFTPLHNLVDGSFYGDPDFTPSWEWVEFHAGWIEIAYIFTDDGFGTIIYVQRADGVEPDLIALCDEWGGDTPTD